MIVAIQPDNYVDGPSSPRWSALLEQQGCEVRWVDVYRPDILEQVRGCDGFMWRYGQRGGMVQIARRLMPVLEQSLGMVVYPDARTAWHFDDKVAQAYLFRALGIPTPLTWTWFDRDAALEWAGQAEYPLVLKLSAGASSENVRLVRNAREAAVWIDRLFGDGLYQLSDYWSQPLGPRSRVPAAARMLLRGQRTPPPDFRWDLHKNYVMFQEFLPDNDGDTRVTVIGKRAFAFRRLNKPGDFRASGGGLVDWDMTKIDPEAIRLCFKWARKVNGQSTAFDLLRRGNECVVSEVCYTYMSAAVYKCPGHWELTGDADNGEPVWVKGHMWPEEAQIADLLTQLRRRQVKSKGTAPASEANAPPAPALQALT
ncbi:MAG: hypothetical protein JXO22_07375 [Phycisphaerae bacterium]|nr:hypothetical protein [Phycisphaerae bacterium]